MRRLGWKLSRCSTGRRTQRCFNPCSLGCCSERRDGQTTEERTRVSILVLLDVALKEHTSHEILEFWIEFQSLFSWMLLWKLVWQSLTGTKTMFQSLFSWMLLWKRWDGRVWRTSTIVSILVLLDVALKEDVLTTTTGSLGVSILVLLDVALKAFDGKTCQAGTWRFNPCSLGCCSERLHPADDQTRHTMFQSLFSWMLLWKRFRR